MTDVIDLAADHGPDSLGAAAWEDPPRSVGPNDAPVLSADGFEGPLDWLLELARAQKIDLAKLPIADLIQSFVTALDAALARPDGLPPVLSRWGDWLVMAATLTHLRSRLLLPAEAPEAQAALSEAEALRRQLVGREQMRAAADWLERQPQLGREVFARGRPEGRAARCWRIWSRSRRSASALSGALMDTSGSMIGMRPASAMRSEIRRRSPGCGPPDRSRCGAGRLTSRSCTCSALCASRPLLANGRS